MLTRNLVGGIVSMLLGAVYTYFAYGIRASALADTMGAGGVPRVYGWLMVVLGAILSIQSILVYLRSPEKKSLASEWQGQGLKIIKAGGLVCIGIVYLLIVNNFGYLPSIALLLIVVALYRGAPMGLRLIATGIGGAIFLWIIFAVVLGVRMPSGVLKVFGI
jgi:hypothetical protein